MGLMRKLGLKPPVARAASAAGDDAGSDDPDPDERPAGFMTGRGRFLAPIDQERP
jgi:hypothetical protein